MSRIEMISLFFNVVGLLADTAAIITFAAGLWNFELFFPKTVNPQSILKVFLTLSALFIIYSWFSLVWILTKQLIVFSLTVAKTKKGRFENFIYTLIATVGGVGILLIPVSSIWFYLMMGIGHTVTEPLLAFVLDFFLSLIGLIIIGAFIFFAIVALIPVRSALLESTAPNQK